MPIPILRQADLLIASMRTALTDHELNQVKDRLTDMVGRERCSGVIIDVSALDVMDSFAARTLRSLAETLKLRGAETVIVGIQPDVAFAMVQLGLRLDGVATALDLDEGMELLAAKRNGAGARGR